MKNLILSLTLFFSLASFIGAQEHKSQLLHEPANWAFERSVLPPSFASGITYKGVEELRFAPGMFKKDTATYFTYIFVAELDSMPSVSHSDIEDYLLKYYKGLCSTVAKDRKLTIDTTEIKAIVDSRKLGPARKSVYDGAVDLFGVFADGAEVRLYLEIKVLTNKPARKTYLYFLASPKEKTDPIWKELYRIRDKFRIPK